MGEEGLRGRQEARVGARLVAFLSSSRFSKSQALLDAVPRATSPLVAVDISSGAGPAAPVPVWFSGLEDFTVSSSGWRFSE